MKEAIKNEVIRIVDNLVQEFQEISCGYYLDVLANVHVIYVEPLGFIKEDKFINFSIEDQINFATKYPNELLCIGFQEKPIQELVYYREGFLRNFQIISFPYKYRVTGSNLVHNSITVIPKSVYLPLLDYSFINIPLENNDLGFAKIDVYFEQNLTIFKNAKPKSSGISEYLKEENDYSLAA